MVPAERRASWRMHTVETGETLASIGKRFRMAPSTIAAANNMRSQTPAVGDHLLIPAAYHEPATGAHRCVEAIRTRQSGKAHKSAPVHRASHAKAKVQRAANFPKTRGKLASAQH